MIADDRFRSGKGMSKRMQNRRMHVRFRSSCSRYGNEFRKNIRIPHKKNILIKRTIRLFLKIAVP